MSNSPFFSIIVATYNQAHLITNCIQSILEQTFADWELIVVNNHSTDNTVDVVESFNDSRIRIIQVHNYGILSVSRNAGIKASKGEWICMLDSDDIWYKDKLQYTYNTIVTNKACDVVCHQLIMHNMVTGEKKLMKGRDFDDNVYKELIYHGNFMSQSALAYNKAFINKNSLFFDENKDFVTVEDYDFSLKLARLGARFVKLNVALGEWRLYGTNWSSSDIHLTNLKNMLYNQVFNIQTFELNKKKLWKDVYSGILIKTANNKIRKGEKKEGFSLLIKVLFECPERLLRYATDRIKLAFYRITYKF